MGFDITKYLFDNQPIGVVIKDDTDPTPVEIASYDSIVPSHYGFTPQQSENFYERGDGSQGKWPSGIRGELVLTVSEQDTTLVDSIKDGAANIEVTILKTSKVISFAVEKYATHIVNNGGEVELHFHVSGPFDEGMSDIFTVT